MPESVLAEEKHWNNYWGLDKTKRFTKISWSKRRIMRVLQPYVLAEHRALDAGCGSGFFSSFLCNQKMEVTALDYSPEALAITKELTQGKAKLLQADLLKDQLAKSLSGSYDLIFTDGLFEHFDASAQNTIMKNLMSVLSPQGVIVTFVPNKFSPWELIRPFYMPGIKEDPFTLSQLVDLNKRNQLKVIAQGGLNTFPFRFSPDAYLGSAFGMLLYTISVKS